MSLMSFILFLELRTKHRKYISTQDYTLSLHLMDTQKSIGTSFCDKTIASEPHLVDALLPFDSGTWDTHY